MNQLANEFAKNGWMILDLVSPDIILHARQRLQKQLVSLLGKETSLEEYHLLADDDPFHTDIQIKMTDFFRKEKFGPSIISEQISFFHQFMGLDLRVQANPYLRMTRPNKKQDNIGYHRDTFYGGSPYELSVLIPFVELNEKNALKVMPGSHIFHENHFSTTQIENPDSAVKKGTAKHQLGFLYAPKMMDPSTEEKMKPIPLKIGQALIFSLSIVHGSIENLSNWTRWSTDIRVMNAFAPVDLSARPDYYEPLSSSQVTQQAEEYFSATLATI